MSSLRALIVGLDGASYALVEEGARTGRLPFLARLSSEGRLGRLRSVIPAVSPSAWSSMLTGVHPGKHGVLHFVDGDTRNPDAPESLITSRRVRGRTFLDGLARAGLRVGAVCIPATFPPWDVGGVMVSGYPCPEGRWSVCPSDLTVRTPPGPTTATVVGTNDDGPLADAVSAMWRRLDLVSEIASRRSLDVLMVVFSAVDHVQHLYGWEGTRRRIRFAYREADRLLEAASRLADSGTLVMVVSDHGGAPPPTRVFRTKRWLIEQGLAEEGKGPPTVSSPSSDETADAPRSVPEWVMQDPRFLQQIAAGVAEENRRVTGSPVHLDTRGVDACRSKVLRYRLCDLSEGLVVNLSGRQRDGTVRPEEFLAVRSAVIEAARGLQNTDPARRILKDVVTRDHLFPGAPPDRALPDIVLLLEDGVRAVGQTDGPAVEPIDGGAPSARGGHSIDGVWGLMGPGVARGGKFEASIMDVAPTVLEHFGVSGLQDADGSARRDLVNRNPY